jgi:hypothetical protein
VTWTGSPKGERAGTSESIFDAPLIVVSTGTRRPNEFKYFEGIGNMDFSCAGILAAQPSQKRDAQFPNTKQVIVRVLHELHHNNFMMSNLRRGVIYGTRDA